MATKEKTKAKEQKKDRENGHSSILPPDMVQALTEVPDMLASMESKLGEFGVELKDIKETQEIIDRRTTPTIMKSVVKEGTKELEEETELENAIEREEEYAEYGPVSRSVRYVVNLLPQGRRERGQFIAGFLVGSATSSVVAPIGIIAASVARGRVIISS